MSGQEVRRHPRQLLRIHLDGADVVANVAAEVLPDLHQLFVEAAHLLSGRRIPVDAGAPKLQQGPIQPVAGGGTRGSGLARPPPRAPPPAAPGPPPHPPPLPLPSLPL